MPMALLAVVIYILLTASAVGHDSQISQGGFRNKAGEWCCGVEDCFVIKGVQSVSLPGPGWRLPSGEFIHQRDTISSPDGQFHRCQRPDGTMRCFFAPLPAM